MQNISGANKFPYALHSQNLVWTLNLIHTNSGKMAINFDVHISYRHPVPQCRGYSKRVAPQIWRTMWPDSCKMRLTAGSGQHNIG